jgi:hypothetical protein
MIPENRLSTQVIFDNLLTPDPQPSLLISRELGGVGIQDPSQGLRVKVWTCTIIASGLPLVPDQVTVESDDDPPVVLFSALGITEVCLAFDQNMRPFVAFVSQGIAKFYWYDSLIENTTITDLPAGSSSPRCTLDDTRALQDGTSDIILVYIDDGNLYYRQERDRYTIQYVLYADINLDIISPTVQYVAMQLNYRLQFSVRGNFS